MKSPHEWFYEIKQSEKEPIRLSDIDNLLEDSIFTSSNGAKLAEYVRKKRGTAGRVRLQNIFEQVAANIPKPIFNFDVDSSDPNPLPESPNLSAAAINDGAESATSSAPVAGTSAPPVQNGNDVVEVVSDKPILTPVVVVHDLKGTSPKPTAAKSSEPGTSNLGRQVLLNQYHRTNMAKCELLRQITSSTPKPEAVSSLSRISAFTTSISPITEAGTPRISEPGRVAPQSEPPLEMPMSSVPVVLLQVPEVPIIPVDTVPPPQILAPCSQAPAEVTPRKVIVVSTPAVPAAPPSPNMIIPETPSPHKQIEESPKVGHQIVPRRLSVTFNNPQDQGANESNENITSDESELVVEEEQLLVVMRVEEEQPEQKPSVKEKKVVQQEQPMEQEQPIKEGQLVNQEPSEEESKEEEPVNQVESIDQEQPAMRKVSQQERQAETSIITKSILKDSFTSQKKRHSFRVSFSQQLVQQREISPAPSIPEAHYSSSSDDSSEISDDEDFEDCEYQVVDEVYSDDGECDPHDIEENYNELVRGDELEKRLSEIHDRIPSPLINVVDEAPVQWFETRSPRSHQGQEDKLLAPATCTKDNKTDLQLVDIITDWDDEDDDEEGEKDEQEQSPAKESQPEPIDIPETQASTQNTNLTVCDAMDISSMEDSAERLVELPPPPASFNGTLGENMVSSPPRAITPPPQFTNSAKRRFLQENDDALISRIQNELPPPMQPPLSPPSTPPERVSDTLIDLIQTFRDQPPLPIVTAASRKTIVPVKKPRRTTTVVDPATNSYFEAVMKPFAQPTAPAPSHKQTTKDVPLTTAQKRKLYASSNGVVVKSVQPTNGVVAGSSTAALRNFRIIVRKLGVDSYPGKLTDADRAAIGKANNVKPNTADAIQDAGKKTEEKTEVGRYRQEQPTKAQSVLQEAVAAEPPEPAFAGFDELKDLDRQPNDRERYTSANPASAQQNNPERDLHREQNAPPNPEVRSKRVVKTKKNANTKELDNAAEKVGAPPAEVDEPSNERLNSNEEQDPLDTQVEGRRPNKKKNNKPVEKIAEPTLVEPADEPSNERVNSNEEQNPLAPEVEGRRAPRKKNNKPAEKIAEPTVVETADEPSNERLNSNEEQDLLDTQVEGRRPTKKKNNKPVEKITEPTVVETAEEPSNERVNSNEEQALEVEGRRAPTRKKKNNPVENIPVVEPADENSNERLTPIEVHDPLAAAELKGRRAVRGKKQTANVDEANNDPAGKIDEQTSDRSDEHSDERINPEREEIPASIPQVLSTESADQNQEEERIISRTPLEPVDVLPSETQPRKRGRPLKTRKPTVQPTTGRTGSKANSKKIVQQSNEANNSENEEDTQPGASGSSEMSKEVDKQSNEANDSENEEDTQPGASGSSELPKDVDKDAQSLPFKKRKGRMLSDDEPPTLEPFGGAAPVDSNDNIPPLLTPNDPAPSTSSRRRNERCHEKHTKEKPEKRLPRFYQDVDEADETWVPNKKSLKDRYNRQLCKKVDTVASRPRSARQAASEEEEPIRRSNRTRRLAEAVVKRNPTLKSIYDKPNYRQLTDEEFVALTREASRRAAEKNQKKRAKPKTVGSESTNVVAPESRKRLQEDLPEPTTSKRNRPDDMVVLDSDVQPVTIDPSPSTAETERTSSTQTMEAYSWMLKLMQTNGVQCIGQENTGLIVGGQYMHYSQEHLSFRERNGIQYSFYLHSDTENYGFLRFSPSAVKKLTKTEKFLLKFLILEGNLSFQLNGQKIQAKGGDFLMLPEYSTYAIENGNEVSLIFMIKLCPSLCEV